MIFEDNYIHHYPKPEKLVHDNEDGFKSRELKNLIDTYGIYPNNTTLKRIP